MAKQEIAELRRQNKREGLDLTYLKNVILRGFESGELSNQELKAACAGQTAGIQSCRSWQSNEPKSKNMILHRWHALQVQTSCRHHSVWASPCAMYMTYVDALRLLPVLS